jgi:pimeloyl-ACP methyl ester carboxylesterase
MPKAKVNGININYRIEGQGEPLVMIMGIGADRTAWRFQTPTFKKHYRVVTFDNRGVGKSDKPTGPYSIKMMADDTVGLMNHLGIEKAHVLGVSMGGMIAQELAINYPERVLRLVLSGTFARRDDSSGLSPELYQALGYDEGYSDDDLRNTPIIKQVGASVYLALNKRLYKIIALLLMPLIKFQIRLMGTTGILGQQEALLGHDTADRLGIIKAPTLVITGSKDRVFKPSSSEVIAELIPNARLVKVDGGSHSFPMEMRSRFNKEVLDFLKGD